MNKYQQTHIDRLRLGSFNNMDGDLVANALIKHENLWDSFVFGRFSNYGGNLIELRDLSANCINADTLYILTDKSKWPELKKVLEDRNLHIDELGFTAADGEVWGTAPYKNAQEVNTEMGGGFWIMKKGSGFPRTIDKKPELSDIPVLVRVWWD